MNHLARTIPCIVSMWLTLGAPVRAQSPDAVPIDAARALDLPLAHLTIQAEEVPAALARIGEQVGIAITLDDASADLLPWGPQTRLKEMTVENASLREVLPPVLGALGMTYEIRDDGLFVVATAPLKRLARRATWDDLRLLRRCHELPYTPENFSALELQYRITSKVDAPKMLRTQLAKAPCGSVAEMLESATGALGWVWFPNGDNIVIRTVQAQIANAMARRITTRYTHVPLSRILAELAEKADTPINFEPGMMLRLPPITRESYSLLLRRTSIRQAFELISAETGIEYDIRRDGIHVGLSEQVGQAEGRPATRRGSPYVAKISVPGGGGRYTFEILLREEELPEDILEYRRQIKEEYFQKMRADLSPDHTRAGED
ncbi:MAG: hypothetical protein ACE5EC_02465 [Phycisphaerae bacterium]